jgi:RHS repeat-associated protein
VGDRTFHYLYGLEADQVLAQDSETGMVWSLADRLGSIDVLVNSQGVIVDQRTYDSFGNTLSQLDPTVKFRFGYTGRESDPETGLYYYRARYFDANVGRFISTDPIGFEAGDANLYRYVGNRSTMYTDPSGELGQIALGAIGGGIFGGLYALADDIQKNEFGWNTFGNVTRGAAFGAAGGALMASGIGLVGLAFGAETASVAGTATFMVSTAFGLGSGIKDISEGRFATGILDVGASLLGAKLFKPPGGGSGSQFAMAGSQNTVVAMNAATLSSGYGSGLIGGIIGSKANDLFKSHFAANTDGNSSPQNPHKYEGVGEYEFTAPDGSKIKHSVDHSTSPIKIPANVNVNPQFKIGKGKDGKGNDPFQQVEFKWTDANGWEYNARWHTERQGAPAGAGRPWIVTRKKLAIIQESTRVEKIRPDGSRDNIKVITQEYVPPQKEIYLQPHPEKGNRAEWVNRELYDKASNKPPADRLSADQILLDRGHWQSNPSKK